MHVIFRKNGTKRQELHHFLLLFFDFFLNFIYLVICCIFQVREITNHFEVAGNPELRADLEGALSALEAEGLLSPQTVEHFINRPVLRQKKTGASQSFKSRVKSPLKVKMK